MQSRALLPLKLNQIGWLPTVVWIENSQRVSYSGDIWSRKGKNFLLASAYIYAKTGVPNYEIIITDCTVTKRIMGWI